MTTQVYLETYSDADFRLSQDSPLHPVRIGSNPLHMHVRTLADDNTVWLDATSVNGMLLVQAGTGDTPDVVSIFIPQNRLLNLPVGDYVYSLIMSNVNLGLRTEVWRGALKHSAGPTRWTAGKP